MVIIRQYRMVPLPDAGAEAFESRVKGLALSPTRVTRSLSSSLMKSTGEVPTYVWSAVVDSMNDKYDFPSAAALQEQIKDVGIITGHESFHSVQVD